MGRGPRHGTADDVPAITALVNQAFEIEAFFKRGARTTPAEIAALMKRGAFLVIDEGRGGSLDACVYMKLNEPTAYFGMLAVDPASQGRGLGRRLIDTVEWTARCAGCHHVEIHVVNLRTDLVPYYRRLGYIETGTLPFPDDEKITQPCHFIVMTKPVGATYAPEGTEST